MTVKTKKPKTKKGEPKEKKPPKVRVKVEPPLIRKMTQEEVLDGARLTPMEARALVNMYYSIQTARVGAGNRESAIDRDEMLAPFDGPMTVRAIRQNLQQLERGAFRALAAFAGAQPLGRWAMSFRGVGEVTVAGLLAHIDLTRCACPGYGRGLRGEDREKIPAYHLKVCPGLATVGALWRYAGLDPTTTWGKGEFRPYNADLKKLCFLIGQNMVRSGNCEGAGSDFYARLYRQRKAVEERKNERGEFAGKAAERLASGRGSSDSKKVWKTGRLQPNGVDRMARRWAVKIFLSHYHQVGREMLGLPNVKPWAIEHGGHSKFIAPPNWPMP